MENSETITGAELCDLIGVTESRVVVLARSGVIPKAGRNRFNRRDAVRAYCARLRDGASRRGVQPSASSDELKAQKIRLATEQADKIAAQNAATRRELLPAIEVERAWASILSGVRSGMLSLPSRLGQRLGHLTPFDLSEMDHEIRALLTEMSDGD